MKAEAKRESEELRQTQEELFRELDKGIRDMEEGRVIPVEQAIKDIAMQYGLILDV